MRNFFYSCKSLIPQDYFITRCVDLVKTCLFCRQLSDPQRFQGNNKTSKYFVGFFTRATIFWSLYIVTWTKLYSSVTRKPNKPNFPVFTYKLHIEISAGQNLTRWGHGMSYYTIFKLTRGDTAEWLSYILTPQPLLLQWDYVWVSEVQKRQFVPQLHGAIQTLYWFEGKREISTVICAR